MGRKPVSFAEIKERLENEIVDICDSVLQFGSIYGKVYRVAASGRGDDVEILIVDDGSHDRTAEIADAYEKKYPGIIRAIHQENGGHGEAVNDGYPQCHRALFSR